MVRHGSRSNDFINNTKELYKVRRKYHTPKEYQDAANSETTDVLELAALSKSEYNFVKLAVVNNSNVSAEILDSLVPDSFDSWEAQEISAAITENSKTSSKTLGKLAHKLIPFLNSGRNNDLASKAGINLFRHPETPVSSLAKILNSDKVSVLFKRKAARETNRKDALDLLLKDKSEAVRKRASKNLESNFDSLK